MQSTKGIAPLERVDPWEVPNVVGGYRQRPWIGRHRMKDSSDETQFRLIHLAFGILRLQDGGFATARFCAHMQEKTEEETTAGAAWHDCLHSCEVQKEFITWASADALEPMAPKGFGTGISWHTSNGEIPDLFGKQVRFDLLTAQPVEKAPARPCILHEASFARLRMC
ncbi:hypothetical protein TWF730_008671 [Orbilia blumenaviensis]|uniref:Uncharacterized protein n=1 Tax=Orbilia blumenaviensis TaxID=1796055 RepID=A0AAV9V3C9_9PEZI